MLSWLLEPGTLDDPDSFPMMVAHPGLRSVQIETALRALELPDDSLVVLDPYCPPVQAFRINQPVDAVWIGAVR